jgi:hypothetical protein
MEKLHNEELHILYSSPNIIRHIKSGTVRWVGHWHTWKGDGVQFWWESQKERDHLEGQGVDGRMESKWIYGDGLGECIE